MQAPVQMKSKSRQLLKALDLRFILIVFLLFLTVSSIPYLYGYFSTPSGMQFNGLIGWDVPGTYMYFMWEEQAVEGSTLFADRLTPETHEPFYFNAEWWLLGRFLRYTGLSLESGFQVERTVTLFFAFCVIYYFLTCFFEDLFERRAVFIWILLTSGFGWFFYLLKQYGGYSWPIRVWDIEGVNLFGYLANKPHFIRSLTLICLSYALLLKGETKDSRIYFFLAGLVILVQGIIRPYDLPTAFLLVAIFPALLAVRDGRLTLTRTLHYLVTALTAVPILFYYLLLDRNFVLRDVFKGVDFPAFTPLEFFVWLGFPFLIALLSFDGVRNFRNWKPARLFLYLWFLIVLVLIYAYPLIPWGMESAGLCYIVSPILAGLFLFSELLPGWLNSRTVHTFFRQFHLTKESMRYSIIIVLIAFSFPSNIVLMHKTYLDLARHSRPYYIPTKVADAFHWLSRHAERQDVVMSHPDNGYHLPVDAGVRSFVGHGHFTINYPEKVAMLKRFFDAGENEIYRRALLKQYGITYLFYGDLERQIGSFDPYTAEYLKPVYSNSLVTIFQVDTKKL